MKKMKRKITLALCLLFSVILLSGCISLTPPEDPEVNGDQNHEPTLSAEYVYELAKAEGYSGTLEDFIAEFKGESGVDGVGIADIKFDEEAHLIITLTNDKIVDCGAVKVNVEPTTISIGDNGNWYINGEDTGYSSAGKNGTGWLSGSTPPPVNAGEEGDLYFDSETSSIYKKELGEWRLIANLKSESDSNITVNAGQSSEKYAAAKAMLSAVSVESIFQKNQYGTMREYSSVGAGVIYRLDKATGEAYIITNHHVVYDANCLSSDKISTDIGIYIYGKEYPNFRIPVTYIGGSVNYDIAVLKVEESEILAESDAKAVSVADSDTVRVLDTAIAIGNPAGLGISATLGSVSVESQNVSAVAHDGKTATVYRYMRIDTPVNSGNSGGGLFDSEGRLIGIVSAKESDQSLENMGYAIPSNVAISVAENIIANCDGGGSKKVIRADLGITLSIYDAYAEYDTTLGVLIKKEFCAISAINANSILSGKVSLDDELKTVKIGSVSFEIEHSYDLVEAMLNALIGDEVTLYLVSSSGAEYQVTVLLDSLCFEIIA